MGKVVITQEQAVKIRGWEYHTGYPGRLLELRAQYLLTSSKCLQSLTLDELARVIYVGYEVEEKFKVGDKVFYRTMDTGMHTIIDMQAGICNLRGSVKLTNVETSSIRLATESEIAAEKERRMGSKLDKILLDSSYTLNQEQAYKDLQEEKRLVEEECERYKKMFSEEKGKSIALYNQNKHYEQALEFGIKYLQASDIGQVQIVVQAMKEALGESE